MCDLASCLSGVSRNFRLIVILTLINLACNHKIEFWWWGLGWKIPFQTHFLNYWFTLGLRARKITQKTKFTKNNSFMTWHDVTWCLQKFWLLTDTADTKSWCTWSSLGSSLGSTFWGSVTCSHSSINSIASVVVELHNLENTEHWNKNSYKNVFWYRKNQAESRIIASPNIFFLPLKVFKQHF